MEDLRVRVEGMVRSRLGSHYKRLLPLTIMGMRMTTLMAKFALTVFIARYMDLASLGLYGLLAGVAVVVPVVFSMGILNSLSRDVVTQSKAETTKDLTHYWAAMACLYAVATLGLLAYGALTGHPVMVLAIVAITMLEHVNQDLFVTLINMQQPVLANVLLFLRSALWILVFMGAALLVPDLRNMDALMGFWIIGTTLPVLAFAVLSRAWPWAEGWRRHQRLAWFKTRVWAARYLYLSDLSFVCSQYLDRYVITLMMGLEMAGVYVFFWQIGNAVFNLINSGILQLYAPRMIAGFANEGITRLHELYVECRKSVLLNASALCTGAGLAVLFILLPLLKRPLVFDFYPLQWVLLAAVMLRALCHMQGMVMFAQRMDRAFALSNMLAIPLSVGFMTLAVLVSDSLYAVGVAGLLPYGVVYAVRSRLIREVTSR